MKKIFSLLCAFVLVVTMLIGTACSKGNGGDVNNTTQNSSSSVTSAVGAQGSSSQTTSGVQSSSSVSSSQTSTSGNQGVGGNGSQSGEKAYTRIDVDGAESASGEYILFGTYPQSEVEDSEIVTTLTTKAGALPTNGANADWTSYNYYIESSNTTDYMWYIDIDNDDNGTKDYRGVYFTSYRPTYTGSSSSESSSFQDDNGYNTSNIYWFKYEPIKWRILSESSAETLILCEMIIDSREFDDNNSFSNNYAQSNIRAWLNDDFYNTAFNVLQKEIIKLTTVDNSASVTSSTSNSFACENTQDHIFLLSYQDLINSNYGFATGESIADTARQRKTTAYAQCQGTYTDTNLDYEGYGDWWLRTPNFDDKSYADGVSYDGCSYYYNGVDCTHRGVCPALYIRLA